MIYMLYGVYLIYRHRIHILDGPYIIPLEYRTMRIRNILILLLVGLQLVHSSLKDYQLEFDWMLNTLSTNVEYGYATWNDGTMITLKENNAPLTKRHEKVAISFVEGINQLSFFFIGANGQITIDNVVITKPPKTINLVFNGDFQLPLLQSTSPALFNAKIPGWQADSIMLARNQLIENQPSQALQLDAKRFQITQKITFGKIINYSFLSNVRDQIQNLASDLIKQKMAAFSQDQPQSWSSRNMSILNSTGNSDGNLEGVISMMQGFQGGNTTSISSQIQAGLQNQMNALKAQNLMGSTIALASGTPLSTEFTVPSLGTINLP